MAARTAKVTGKIVGDLEDMALTLKAAAYGACVWMQGLPLEDRDHRILALFVERVEDEAAGLEEIAKAMRATMPPPVAIRGA